MAKKKYKTDTVKRTVPLKKVGDSYYLLVDADARSKAEIGKGDTVMFILKKVESKEVKCPLCGYKFDVFNDEILHECQKCGKEWNELDREENELHNKVDAPQTNEGLVEDEAFGED